MLKQAIFRSRQNGESIQHVEMFEYHGGFIFDTPGFTSFDILDADANELASYYPEFAPYTGRCQFDNCRHMSEPGCAVKEAVNKNKINAKRYGSYVSMMHEIEENKEY